MDKTALVLEGGGFRGLFTSGVLDCFMEESIQFPYVIGVSMGACNGASYISNQHGRNKVVNMDFVRDTRYMSLRRLFTRGELFGMDFIFNEIPSSIEPFDFEAYWASPQTFKIVVTDIETGQPMYLNSSSNEGLMSALQASASLPFISKPVMIDGRPCLDGGISDSIPFEKALEDGFERIVVVFTQPRAFLKEESKADRLARYWYRRYPELERLLRIRHENYNTARRRIFEMEAQGKAFIIEPPEAIPAGRIEKDRRVLEASFDMGYSACRSQLNGLRRFLGTHGAGE